MMATKNEKLPVKAAAVAKTGPAGLLIPFEQMEQMFEAMFRNNWQRLWSLGWPAFHEFDLQLPKMDVVERDHEIVVKAAVPGMSKKDIDVQVGEASVTIKGSTKHEEKEEKGDYCRSEIRRSSFNRTVALPGQVDGAKAKATFKDGMLELVLPKSDNNKRHSVRID